MKAARFIDVAISNIGDVKLSGTGFNGRECDAFMKPIEDALAGSGEVDKKYDERWAGAKTTETVAQRW